MLWFHFTNYIPKHAKSDFKLKPKIICKMWFQIKITKVIWHRDFKSNDFKSDLCIIRSIFLFDKFVLLHGMIKASIYITVTDSLLICWICYFFARLERMTKSINCEKVRFHAVLFWRNGARVHEECMVDPVSLFWFVGRTVVGSTSRMSACWHDRRKLKPECTDRMNNQELGHGDTCRRGGRSRSSPGPPHPTSATADAWLPTQMIGTVVAV